jgi:multiple sugar transport system permease protein
MQAIQAKPRPARPSGRRRELRRLVAIYSLVIPGLVLFAFWTIYPLVDAFVMSFTQWNPNPSASSPFVGGNNYGRALHDPVFWQALGNVVWYTVVTVPGQMALGLAVALILNKKIFARGVFRVLYYLPVVTSWLVVGYVFEYLFNSQGGLVDWLLGDVVHLIPDTQPWFGDPTRALPTLMIMGIWKGVGWNMVIFLAGLQSIPPGLYEAASVDGASAWAKFRSVTLPLLSPTLVFVSVILVIGAVGVFIPIFTVTQGGPENATETLVHYGYYQAFSAFDFGYGAAITYLFAAFVAMLSIVQLVLMGRKAEY